METPVRNPRIDPRYANFKLAIRKSKIHRYGVYAEERIPPNRKVIEYTGERINRRETKRRSDGEYTYLFTLDSYWTIDGAFGGSGAEIINHSCEPNLVTRIIKGHILYMSRREIQPGEELTVDYNFDYTGEKTPCSCGAPACRGVMERLTPKLKRELEKEKAAKAAKRAHRKKAAKTAPKKTADTRAKSSAASSAAPRSKAAIAGV
jgi:hypothetical protein